MSQGYVANANISPCTIVKYDTSSTAPRVIQAAANSDVMIGVAQAGTHQTPLAGLDDGYAATAGLNLTVFTVGDLCQVKVGAAVNAGDQLTSDSSGRAITASAGQQIVGYAEEAATAVNQFIQMRVQPGKI